MSRILLIGSLLVLSACSSSKEIIRRQQQEIAQLRVQNEELRDQLAGIRPGDAERVFVTEPCGEQECVGETITVLLTDLYFESGSAKLTPDGVSRLADVARTIKGSFAERRIRVEGHTDSNPIGPSLKDTYPSNWELSSARAAAVVRHFQWTHGMVPEQFEVVGFGHYQPVAPNTTADGRKQNRRVRIAVLPE
ncbi:MAG: OmpA family protein [Rhodothermales bacterium]|nr:OmpA family protein [Rhodothermales bacterium]